MIVEAILITVTVMLIGFGLLEGGGSPPDTPRQTQRAEPGRGE